MKNYKISVHLKIETPKDSYSLQTIAESEVNQIITIPAHKVRDSATQIIRQAVANMSQSAETGLKEIIELEPIEIKAKKQEELTV